VGLARKLLLMIGLILFIVAISASIAWLSAGGIEYVRKKHPNYKRNDFLDWDKHVNQIAGRDSWDDLKDEIY
jgi:flagellar basal body-associated protein FliL